MTTSILSASRVSKSFGSKRAVDDVTVSIEAGEVVAIVGENGAGKTTLIRIVAGELEADSGRVELQGRAGFVHQHFMLVNDFSIVENLALGTGDGRPLRSRSALERQAEAIIAQSGIALADVRRLAASLAVGEKSKLELIKAIARRPSLLILDEPTSVLTPYESADLFRVMRELAAGGAAVAFISHKLGEVLEVATRIVVMRAGRLVAESEDRRVSAAELAAAMIGELPSTSSRRVMTTACPPRTVIRFSDVHGDQLDGLSLEVRQGEIVAIAGVAGNGQVELAAMLRGLKSPRSGSITMEASRLGFIPEDRTTEGVVAEMSIAENLALTQARWQPRAARRRATALIAAYGIRAESADQLAGSLSGGNQQKVLLARELETNPDAVVAAEPTRGLDIEAAHFVHEKLLYAAQRGAAILLITSDLDEVFALAEAIHVIYRGRLSERLTPAEAGVRIAELMAGIA